jgi:hypothetical protein
MGTNSDDKVNQYIREMQDYQDPLGIPVIELLLFRQWFFT